MVDLVDEVKAILMNDDTISVLAPGGVHWVRPPGEGPYLKAFLVVAESGNSPQDFADDREIESLINIQIEVYSPGKFGALKEAVNNAMVAAGYTRESVGVDGYIPEFKLYTKPMAFSIEKGVV